VTGVGEGHGLAELERRVDHALTTGDEGEIEVLGYGEISCVLGWNDGEEGLAAKRLPLFDSSERLDRYRQNFDTYLKRLSEAGVMVVPSRLESTQATHGRIAAWCLQPLLDASALATNWLKDADRDGARRIIELIADRIIATIGPELGLDGQLSNWAVVDDEVLYFDVTTPMMRDRGGRELLDVDLFIASLPWALRGLARRIAPRMILDTYYRPREVLRDLVANFIKEGVFDRIGLALEIVNRKIEPRIGEAEVRRYYQQDARMYSMLQGLRRVDRAWQRRVRRRQYPFLLPGKVERHV
jgi:hypothetical protein